MLSCVASAARVSGFSSSHFGPSDRVNPNYLILLLKCREVFRPFSMHLATFSMHLVQSLADEVFVYHPGRVLKSASTVLRVEN